MSTEYSPLLSLFSAWPNLRRADGRALSVYVPARADGYDARYYDIVFGDLRHRYRERLGDKDLGVMEHELPRLRSHLAELRPARAAALAAFAESSSGLLEVINLPQRAEERLEVGELLLAPALRQLEQFPPSLVAVVDKRHARTFAFVLDELRARGAIRGESALGEAAAQVAREMRSGAYNRLYVAGPPAAKNRFERLIPEKLRKASHDLAGISMDSAHLELDVHRQLTTLHARLTR